MYHSQVHMSSLFVAMLPTKFFLNQILFNDESCVYSYRLNYSENLFSDVIDCIRFLGASAPHKRRTAFIKREITKLTTLL